MQKPAPTVEYLTYLRDLMGRMGRDLGDVIKRRLPKVEADVIRLEQRQTDSDKVNTDRIRNLERHILHLDARQRNLDTRAQLSHAVFANGTTDAPAIDFDAPLIDSATPYGPDDADNIVKLYDKRAAN